MSTCQVCEATTQAFLCARCTRELEQAAAEMPSLLTELSVKITRRAQVYRGMAAQRQAEEPFDPERAIPARLRTKDGRVALRPTALPVDLDASELYWVAYNTIGTWARIIAEHRALPAEEWPTSANLLVWLATYAESVRWQDDAAECHDQITAVRAEILRAIDRSPDRVYAGPCEGLTEDGEKCGLDLYRESSKRDDDDVIVCDGWRTYPRETGCGERYTLAERRDWLVASVRERLSSVDELLDALPVLFPKLPQVPRQSVMGWIRSGRIMAKGRNAVGDETYSVAELLKLIAEYKPHAYAPRKSRKKDTAA